MNESTSEPVKRRGRPRLPEDQLKRPRRVKASGGKRKPKRKSTPHSVRNRNFMRPVETPEPAPIDPSQQTPRLVASKPASRSAELRPLLSGVMIGAHITELLVSLDRTVSAFGGAVSELRKYHEAALKACGVADPLALAELTRCAELWLSARQITDRPTMAAGVEQDLARACGWYLKQQAAGVNGEAPREANDDEERGALSRR